MLRTNLTKRPIKLSQSECLMANSKFFQSKDGELGPELELLLLLFLCGAVAPLEVVVELQRQ